MDGWVWVGEGKIKKKRMEREKKSEHFRVIEINILNFLLLFKNDDEWRREERERNDEERKGNHTHTHRS